MECGHPVDQPKSKIWGPIGVYRPRKFALVLGMMRLELQGRFDPMHGLGTRKFVTTLEQTMDIYSINHRLRFIRPKYKL